jgi:hypothetical protein
MTLWREHDRLVVAITRGANLVYYQALPEGRITPRVVQDLSCAQATLTMQDILTPLQKVMLWTEVSPEELAALHEVLPLPVDQEECPPPVTPAKAWKLVPAVVSEAKRTRESRRWQRRALMIFLAVYMLAVAWVVSRYVMTSLKVGDLRKWQSDHAQALALVQDGRAAWKDLDPVIDTKSNPLELLRETCLSIPLDQLHLTLFETSDNGKVLIKGEAKNVAAAFQFFTKLKDDPFFSGYSLEMGNPRPLPNDLAQFQISGTRATTN